MADKKEKAKKVEVDEKKETRVRVLDCTFGIAEPGEEITIPKASADYYASINYVEILED